MFASLFYNSSPCFLEILPSKELMLPSREMVFIEWILLPSLFGISMSGKIGRTPPHKDLADPGHEQVGEGTWCTEKKTVNGAFKCVRRLQSHAPFVLQSCWNEKPCMASQRPGVRWKPRVREVGLGGLQLATLLAEDHGLRPLEGMVTFCIRVRQPHQAFQEKDGPQVF